MRKDDIIALLESRVKALEAQLQSSLDVIKNLTYTTPGLAPEEPVETPKFVDVLGTIQSMEAVTEKDIEDKQQAEMQIQQMFGT